MTRKEQKEERKKQILMTALTLFVERGYYDTKIADIAAAVPMSTGLMFHYFESKEELLLELVKMGAAASKATAAGGASETGSSAGSAESGASAAAMIPPDVYLTKFLEQLFSYAKEQPWVFHMFVLMGQVRRPGMPEEARQVAQSVTSIEDTAKLIRAGQESGVFRQGDAGLLSRCFWASVQGVMEEMSQDPDMKVPDPAWIVSILKA
jgi:AcrR family transcriptional regulator